MEKVATKTTTTERRRAIGIGLATGLLAVFGLRQASEAHTGSPPVHGDSSTADPAISGDNTDGGPGVQGTSLSGSGVVALHLSATDSAPALVARNHGLGNGVFAFSSSDFSGVHGENVSTGAGVVGRASDGFGVVGQSTSQAGVRGVSTKAPGVIAIHNSVTDAAPALAARNLGTGPGVFATTTSDNSGVHGENLGAAGVGVVGIADGGPGVVGVHKSTTATAAGVSGRSLGAGSGVFGIAPGESPGVLAASGLLPIQGAATLDCGLALLAVGRTLLRPPGPGDPLPAGTVCAGPTLRVEGPSQLAGNVSVPVGGGTIPAGQQSFEVADPSVGPASHILLTLVGAPNRAGEPQASVAWIERLAGGFRVHLTRRPDLAAPFTYVVMNPV